MWFTIEDLSYVALSEYETYKASLQNCSRTITGLMGYGYQAPLEDQYFHGEEIGATYTAIYGEDGRSVRIDFGDFVPLQRCNGNYTLSSCIGVHASDYCESQGYGELPSGTLWKFVSKPRNSCALLQAEWGAVYGWQNGRAAALAISFSLMLALTIFSTSL